MVEGVEVKEGYGEQSFEDGGNYEGNWSNNK